MSTTQPIHNISEQIKIDIMVNHVEPAYKKDVIELLEGKRCWKTTGKTFETISKVFVAFGSIISFAAGVYNLPNLSFIAGSISTISLATLQFASFSFTENKKQSSELNTLLNFINIKPIPLMNRNTETTFRQTVKAEDIDTNTIAYNEHNAIMKEVEKELIGKSNLIEELQKKILELVEKERKQVGDQEKQPDNIQRENIGLS